MFYKRRSPVELSEQELKDAAAAAKTKTPEELRRERLEKKAAELKKKTAKERLEQLDYYKFPTIMGWYFDGTFTKDFTLFEEYAEYFNEIEEELDAQKDLIIEETFTEKAFRYFWPPDFLCGQKYFRTRGIYLDFKEVKDDRPKTPPNINYEKQRGVIGVEISKEQQKTEEEEKKSTHTTDHLHLYGIMGHRNNQDRWYWNESRREYKPKEPDGHYIWANDERIWIEADPTYRTPYDWYFDEGEGKFFIKDRSRPQEYEFDKEKNVFVLKGVKGPSANGLRKNDYCYDENKRKWIPITQAQGNVTFYHAGLREIVKGDRGASGLTPDDYYYDGDTGKMHQKDPQYYHEYYYDVRDKMWKKKGQPYGPGVANHYPMDYEYDLKMGAYFPKHARECKHVEPLDYYFDKHEGRFYRMDGNKRDDYVYDAEQHVFYLKGTEEPSLNGLNIDDYYWNENDREWKLLVTVKDPDTMLDYHDAGKRKVMRGDRGRSGKVPDDFYYDAVDGSFFRKDVSRLSMYWFDTNDMVWKKRGQGYGPGFFRLFPEHYYFDYDEGYYFPTTTGKLLLARLKSGEVKGLSDRTPYDFAFNDAEGYFAMRDKDFARQYKYNPFTGVFHVEQPPGLVEKATHGKSPKDFFFDEFTCTWLPIEHPKGSDARYYKNGRRNNRLGPRGKSGKIPDDFFFNFDSGEFENKVQDDSEAYEYVPAMGVWKKAGADHSAGMAVTSSNNVSRPRDYYFDREEGRFILKSKLQYGEIYLNPYTNLWMQRWRCPSDFYWDSKQQKYLRKPANWKEGGGGFGGGGAGGFGGGRMSMAQLEASRAAEVQQSARERWDYERPWLHNFLVQAATEIRFEQELLKAKNREVKDDPPAIEKGTRKGAQGESQKQGIKFEDGMGDDDQKDDRADLGPGGEADEAAPRNETGEPPQTEESKPELDAEETKTRKTRKKREKKKEPEEQSEEPPPKEEKPYHWSRGKKKEKSADEKKAKKGKSDKSLNK